MAINPPYRFSPIENPVNVRFDISPFTVVWTWTRSIPGGGIPFPTACSPPVLTVPFGSVGVVQYDSGYNFTAIVPNLPEDADGIEPTLTGSVTLSSLTNTLPPWRQLGTFLAPIDNESTPEGTTHVTTRTFHLRANAIEGAQGCYDFAGEGIELGGYTNHLEDFDEVTVTSTMSEAEWNGVEYEVLPGNTVITNVGSAPVVAVTFTPVLS